MALSDTQTSILRQASRHPDGLAVAPAQLPPGLRASKVRALLNAGLVARTETSEGSTSWKLDGEVLGLNITGTGRQPIEGEKGETSPKVKALQSTASDDVEIAAEKALSEAEITGPQPRPKLRDAAAAFVTCWETMTDRESLAQAVAELRAALGPVPRQPNSIRGPRQGTKQEAVLILLGRPEGATIADVVEAPGWAQHTVRGFFVDLKKKGHVVEVLERVRQNGPGNAGAKGSYSIYRSGEVS